MIIITCISFHLCVNYPYRFDENQDSARARKLKAKRLKSEFDAGLDGVSSRAVPKKLKPKGLKKKKMKIKK